MGQHSASQSSMLGAAMTGNSGMEDIMREEKLRLTPRDELL